MPNCQKAGKDAMLYLARQEPPAGKKKKKKTNKAKAQTCWKPLVQATSPRTINKKRTTAPETYASQSPTSRAIRHSLEFQSHPQSSSFSHLVRQSMTRVNPSCHSSQAIETHSHMQTSTQIHNSYTSRGMNIMMYFRLSIHNISIDTIAIRPHNISSKKDTVMPLS